jgi:rhodanese-related sulfurtransferase
MSRTRRGARIGGRFSLGFCAQIPLICLTGIVLSWLANAISPRGLDLSRNYFPTLAVATGAMNTQVTAVAPGAGLTPGPDVESPAPNHTPTPSFQEVLEWLRSPGAADGRLVFIDARNRALFEEGHIPGAHLLDRFYPEQSLPEVLPIAMAAERVIVYCTGGDCEDSEYAALMLQEAGVPVERIMVYSGGITEWQDSRGPVETGDRLSGVLREFESQ